MGWLTGRKTTKHGGGDGRGDPAPPRRIIPVAKCPCGRGKPVGHAGPCRIPTGTYRNGQKTPAPRKRKASTSDKYVKKMGKGI